MGIGTRIKELREKAGYGLTEMADKLDVSKQTLYKYENGIVTNIPSDKIEAIAKMCHASPAYIMGWEQADYYTSDEAAEVAQRLFENRELRMLFDAAKDASAEDLKTTAELLRILKSKEKADE